MLSVWAKPSEGQQAMKNALDGFIFFFIFLGCNIRKRGWAGYVGVLV
jgi:hypothetical protein